MQQLQPLPRHMRINLRSRNIRMPQQHLHHAQVRTVVEQMRRKCMPQSVRRQRLGEAAVPRVLLDEIPEHLPRHAFGTRGDKQRIA